MNKFKKFVSVGIAAALTLTSLPTVVFAEDEFLSATELISATVEMAANNVQSDTYADSLTAVEAKVTTSGDEVFYDGNSIGFWFSDTPNIIYKDAEKTAIALQTDTTTGGYTADPTLLCEIMTDFNNGLVSTAVPTTTDWSKIIGKYDVTLGDITIPADNWYELTPNNTPIDSGAYIDLTAEEGFSLSDYQFGLSGWSPMMMGYVIDEDGSLYLHDMLVYFNDGDTRPNVGNSYSTFVISMTASTGLNGATTPTPFFAETDTRVRVGFSLDEAAPLYYITNNLNTTVVEASLGNINSDYYKSYYNVADNTQKWDLDLSTVKSVGFFWFKSTEIFPNGFVGNKYAQTVVANATEATVVQKFLTSQSSSKLTIGNTTLEQRLAKLVSLAPTDTITVSETGWTVNGIDNLDTYVGTQSVIEPGTGTDVSAVADIEAACFDVIIPTNLPIYVDDHGQVSVADNASIKNKSSLAVKITDVEIKAKPDTGWTLVDTSPSQARDAKEFTFTTSLTTGTELNVDETITFTYDAQISPTTEGYTSLDLATVTVVVDWAE